MASFLFRRLLQSAVVVVGISVIVFVLIEAAPGDLVDSLIPFDAFVSTEAREQYRERLGLNAPAPERYLRWLGRTLMGDLGYSLATQKPISELILGRLPATLELVTFALILSTVIGVVTGILSAIWQYSAIDYLVTIFSFIWLSIPIFFLALASVYLFAIRLTWFPAFGYSDPTLQGIPWLIKHLHHLLLPGILLGLELTAALTRYVRSGMLEVLSSDYLRTARAKGLRESTVIVRHGLRNALIPVITIITLRLPILVSGAVVIETVFQWPGLGMLALSAANQRDYPLVLGLGLVVAIVVVLSNLLADVLYAVADPRIRYSDR